MSDENGDTGDNGHKGVTPGENAKSPDENAKSLGEEAKSQGEEAKSPEAEKTSESPAQAAESAAPESPAAETPAKSEPLEGNRAVAESESSPRSESSSESPKDQPADRTPDEISPPKDEAAAPPAETAKPSETKPAEAIKADSKPAETPRAAPAIEPEPKTPESDREGASGPSFFRRRGASTGKQNLQTEAPPAPPPKKKKRRDGTLSAMSGFLSFLLVALVAAVFGVIATLHKLNEPGPLGADKVVYLPPRSDVPEMLTQLEREGVIDSPGLMNFALLIEGARNKIKPGEYLFKQKASLREVIDELVSGRQLMHSLTIPEGLTSEQITQRLRDSDLLSGDILETPKEGALLPETYKFPRGFPRAKLISKMQDDQRKLIEQIWSKRARDLPLRSPWELVTLASIVEKETGKPEERPRVASVFMNRLRKGMRLQSDPTIVYGLVGGKATLGHGIMRSEIEKWTPYNTYAIDGLPPGPIANPGKAALEATANPASTRDLYFVADGTGGHVFAESLDQHSRNVQSWRKLEQDRKAAPAPDLSAPAAVPPAVPKNDKRTQAPIGRLVTFAREGEDYPVGRAMAADDGATHRLGKFSPAGAAFFLGGHEDPTADAAPDMAKLRVARPYFTEDAAQPKSRAGFDPELLASAAPAPGQEGEEGSIGPDMMARESADGKALPDDAVDIAAYPVSPARRAEQKARAARLGLSTGTDELPADALGARVSPEDAAVQSGETPIALAPTGQRLRPRAFDASEGTPLDPLRDRSWDLTSAKTVPSAANLR